MVFLIILFFISLCFVIHMEEKEEKGYADVNRMIQEVRYRELHPEMKRSVKYMTAGYYVKQK